MIYDTSPTALAVFLAFVLGVLGLSFWLGRRRQSAQGYFAAHGQVHWAVNGLAFAGDYLSAASFLGICGMIASFGFDGFLYSIGYLAGWVVALLVIAEPIKRMGRFTFADALDSRFGSRGIKLAAGLSTLVVSVFYLIPQMVGAGALVTPLLGLPHFAGVLIVGVTVTLIVVTAGMVSTTWVQFIKGSLLLAFCALLTVMILRRGLTTGPGVELVDPQSIRSRADLALIEEPWPGQPLVRTVDRQGLESIWRVTPGGWVATQFSRRGPDGRMWVNGRPQAPGEDFQPVGVIARLAGDRQETGPLGPGEFMAEIAAAQVVTWSVARVTDAQGVETAIYTPAERAGSDLLTPGASPVFKGVRSSQFVDKLDFISLMLALFCGTASLPHILIRYYTVKDQAAARLSTVAGIAAIGFFYVLTLYLGLGAMASGALDVTDNNMAAPLLARSFSELMFAVISAIAFTTVLGTVSGLIMAGAGAVAHDLIEDYLQVPMTDGQKVLYGKLAAVLLGAGAMALGILFRQFNVTFLVGWAFNIAASANLPALVMLLFWPRTTRQGVIAAVLVGMCSSLGWILLSGQTYANVYGWKAEDAPVPFSQPGLVTIPLGFLTLVVVSLLTRPAPVGVLPK